MKTLHLLFFTLLTVSCLHAQDAFFTQYNSAPLYLNPGFTGSTGHARAATSFRDQWPALNGGGYITSNLSYDQYFAKLHGGLGINMQHDVAGDVISTSSVNLSYAFHLPLFENRLVISPAVSVGLLRKHLDAQTLLFGDMIDPRRGFVYNTGFAPTNMTVNNFDLSSGFVAYTKRITVGFSAAHLTQPEVGFFGHSRLPVLYAIHASGVIGHVPGDFENKFSIVPQIAYVQQGIFNQLTGGASVLYKNYSLGMAYRVDDAAIFMVAYQNKLFRASYSYDYTTSKLTNKTGGSHELAVQFYLFRKMKPEDFLAPANIAY